MGIKDMNVINDLKKDYDEILMSTFIARLLEKEISLNHRAKRVYLLCPDAFKSDKSETKIALQKFADPNDEGCDQMRYYKKFPAHREQATDYFKVKFRSNYLKALSDV